MSDTLKVDSVIDKDGGELLEVFQHTAAGYQPLVDFAAWRVAVLNPIEELRPANIETMQRHEETDEVFVLLKGKCLLYIGAGTDRVTEITPVDLEPLKLYNVKRMVWHTHTLSADAAVLIVENRDTTLLNSPQIALDPAQRAFIVAADKGV